MGCRVLSVGGKAKGHSKKQSKYMGGIGGNKENMDGVRESRQQGDMV